MLCANLHTHTYTLNHTYIHTYILTGGRSRLKAGASIHPGGWIGIREGI